jgi:hypothetical protein
MRYGGFDWIYMFDDQRTIFLLIVINYVIIWLGNDLFIVIHTL